LPEINVFNETVSDIDGPWEVTFQPKLAQPFKKELASLIDFSQDPDTAVKYFAGTAAYKKIIRIEANEIGKNKQIQLDLGDLHDIAELEVNEKKVGVLWFPPYSADITPFVKAGNNTITIYITNNWANRLIGDEQYPADFEWGADRGEEAGRAMKAFPEWFIKQQPRPSQGRKGFMIWHYFRKNSPLFPAGLLGPVRLISSTIRSGNPVFQGWYADPEAIIYGDTYWIYPTWSDQYEKQTFFDCFSSKDLVTWTKHASILDTSEVKWAKKAMWAPSVIQKDGKYYFFFGANDVHEGEIGGIGVAVSDRPEGPYKDLLGKPLINDIINGAQPIDQFAFRDGNDYYLYYGGWSHCNIVKLNADFTGLTPFADGTTYKEITPSGYVEGPFMFKRKGKYYFMWSEGGWGGPDYSVAYSISITPFGPV
jgi:hypothetical protein